jgi:hypothetical protein
MTALSAESSMHRVAIDGVYRKHLSSVWFSIAATWAIAYVLWQGAEFIYLLLWASILTVFNVGRFTYALRRIRSADFLDNPRQEERMISLGLLLAGVGFAVVYAGFVGRAPLVEQYAVVAINVGLCAGAAIVLIGSRLAFISFIAPFIGVVISTMLWCAVVEGDTLIGVTAIMLVLYVFGVLLYQRQAESALLYNIRQRFEKDELLAHKDDLLAELHVLNRELSADREAFLTACRSHASCWISTTSNRSTTATATWPVMIVCVRSLVLSRQRSVAVVTLQRDLVVRSSWCCCLAPMSRVRKCWQNGYAR